MGLAAWQRAVSSLGTSLALLRSSYHGIMTDWAWVHLDSATGLDEATLLQHLTHDHN
jgi:hypothetical protein